MNSTLKAIDLSRLGRRRVACRAAIARAGRAAAFRRNAQNVADRLTSDLFPDIIAVRLCKEFQALQSRSTQRVTFVEFSMQSSFVLAFI